MAGDNKSKNETLDRQLDQIREDIQFLRERAGQHGTGMSDNFVFDAKTALTPKIAAFKPNSALLTHDSPMGIAALYQQYVDKHNNDRHREEFLAIAQRINGERKASIAALNLNIEREIASLLNKQGHVWEPVDSTKWKKAFEDSVDPLIRRIDAEIKTIQENKLTPERREALAYEDTPAGNSAYEAAKAHQVKLLEDYKANVKKDLEHLEYTLVLDAIQNQKFRKTNDGGVFGSDLTLHEHAREQLINRSTRAIQSKRFNTTLTWKHTVDGNVIALNTNPDAPLPEGRYQRGDRWKYFSWNGWMDSSYEAKKDGVNWNPVSYRFSKSSTIEEDIDGALVWFNKQTGQQKGYINAGKDVDPNYLIKLAQRATDKGYQLKLSDKTREYLQGKCPEKLQEIDHALGTGPGGVQLVANNAVRRSL